MQVQKDMWPIPVMIQVVCAVIGVIPMIWGQRIKIRQTTLKSVSKIANARITIANLARSPWVIPVLILGMGIVALRLDIHRSGTITRWDIYLISKDVAVITFGVVSFFVLSIMASMREHREIQRDIISIQKEIVTNL